MSGVNVKIELTNVKITGRIRRVTDDQRPYHHGDLAQALRCAAVDVINEKGPAGFSLREVARRAGVSHAAPAHHFGDTRGLLTAIAVEAFQHLDAEMTAVTEQYPEPRERFIQMGIAYVRAGITHPAHCAVLFRNDLVDVDDPAYQMWGDRAYGHLRDKISAIRDAYRPDLDVETASRLSWAAMQGLITLYPSMVGMAGNHSAPIGPQLEVAEQFARLLLDGLIGTPSPPSPPSRKSRHR
jgi:AcrR family transcriptional regulator